MFHVLLENEFLLGKDNSYTGEVSQVFCKREGIREAVSLKRFKQFVSDGKLNIDRCCKACYPAAMRKVGKAAPPPEAAVEAA